MNHMEPKDIALIAAKTLDEKKALEEENKQLEKQVLELIKKGKNINFIQRKTGKDKAKIQEIIQSLIKKDFR